ncbi:hypothetical protein ACFSKN_11055 [Mariniflexile gromovii]|uniref:Uncharacterized protein n=1 Tax=Mariniflexile gromovii TaxID=362523 RepID=A0ABS4BZ33_9FLAO|nr:hypothetical protein [Mariniflexile gromovii]MBP0905292.1 hypothetical protein [Mariniflexile gromovii]
METYLIIGASFSFIIGICKVLKLGMLVRLWQHKKLHPNATLKDIESFEKNTIKSFNFNWNKTQNEKNSFN